MSRKRASGRGIESATGNRQIAFAVILFVVGVLLLSAFIDFSPEQTIFISSRAYDTQVQQNIFGKFGANAVFLSLRYIGLSAWMIPFCFLRLGLELASARKSALGIRRTLAMLLMLVCSSGVLDYIQENWISFERFLMISSNKLSAGLGGLVGYYAYQGFMRRMFAVTGGAVLLLTGFCLSAIFSFSRSPSLNGALEQKIKRYGYFRAVLWETVKKHFIALFQVISWILKLLFLLLKWVFIMLFRLFTLRSNKAKDKPKTKERIQNPPASTANKLTISDAHKNNYIFPVVDLLQKSKKINSSDDHADVSNQLVSTLAQFGIVVNPGDVHVGPVITRYEIFPAPGVRVEKIINLDKNIALNLRAQSVRILAPVPGRGCVGVELPNKNPQMVCLREILESQNWQSMRADIPIVLGRGTTGDPMINDLSKMPHLLIAGSTGSGKTVCINSIIASLVYHSSPDDLRFIMVDPKIVEMQVFNKLPHMLIPVVTDPKKVPNALKWLIGEMELRYKIFAKSGVRNIAGFNAKLLKDAEQTERAKELERELSPEERSAINTLPHEVDSIAVPKTKIPYIVCIIDELADLMMVAPADIETCVARLAQLARAAGIHLILATQRPSVNVITGIIKANLPSRIAFKVASKVDSRTILDIGGAEALLGRGDMLFQPPGASGLLRAQGALVSDDEINRIVDFLHDKNGPPEYAMDVHAMIESGEEDADFSFGGSGDWEDEMMPRALEVIRSSDRASTSLLQRRLKIGYNRAARIMEALEAKGLVKSPTGPQSMDQELL